MISFCIGTARPSYGAYYEIFEGIKGYSKDVHLFEPFVKTLYPQLTEPIELVISDILYDHRDLNDFFRDFPLIKTKVVPQDNWWIKNDRPCYSYIWNECVRQSSGDYLVILTDCLSFPDNFIEKVNEKRKYSLISQILFKEKVGDTLSFHYTDPRISGTLNEKKADRIQGFKEIPWSSCFGFFGIPREWYYKMNGYDENFDGQKGLNDIEFFSRLHTLSEELNEDVPIEFDRDLFVFHHKHGGVFSKTNSENNAPFALRSNYDMIFLQRNLGIWKANSFIYKKEDLIKVVNGEICNMEDCIKQSKDCWNNKDLIEHWINNQPVFNL